jgi:hypothetical protein
MRALAATGLALLLAGPAFAQEGKPLVLSAKETAIEIGPEDILSLVRGGDSPTTPGLEIELTPDAAAQLAAFSAPLDGEAVSIKFCGQEIMRPVLYGPLASGGLRITSQGTTARLTRLVAVLEGQATCGEGG